MSGDFRWAFAASATHIPHPAAGGLRSEAGQPTGPARLTAAPPAHRVATSPPRRWRPQGEDDDGAGSADALKPEDLEVSRTSGVSAFDQVELATGPGGRRR